MKEIHCKKCGNIIKPTDPFCRQCGTWHDKLRNIAQTLALALWTCAILYITYSAIFHTDEFIRFELPYLFPQMLLGMVAFILTFIGSKEELMGQTVTLRHRHKNTANWCLGLLCMVSFFMPEVLENQFEKKISKDLREMDLYGSIAEWAGAENEQPGNDISLATLSPFGSAIIVNGPSFVFQKDMKVSEYITICCPVKQEQSERKTSDMSSF
jgi:hypothetical protein